MSRDLLLCAGCGAKNRADWRLCQRCRRELQTPGGPGQSPGTANGRRAWLAGGIAAVVAAAAIAVPYVRPARVAVETRNAPRVDAGEAAFDRPHVTAPRVEVALTPVTREDFARAGETAYAQGQMGVALSAFEGAAAAFPSDPEARSNLGQMLVRIGRVSEALPHLVAAATAAPGKWAFRFNLARARGLSGDWDGAVADYRVASQIFPDDHVTLYNLGRALQKVGLHEEAAASLERAIALDPSEPSSLLTLAASYEKLSRFPEAIQAYRSFLDREPQSHDASAIRERIGRLEQVGVPDGRAVTTGAPASGT